MNRRGFLASLVALPAAVVAAVKAQGEPAAVIGSERWAADTLTACDLQAPAKLLYPVATPLRNRIPRRLGA